MSGIHLTGVGWLTETEYGSVARDERYRFDQGQGVASLGRAGLFSHPFKNFARLDLASKLTVCAVALALKDAGVSYDPADKQPMGILGSGVPGALASDLAYFSDYVHNGRTLSRANLFIYTLPSSPLGEAAIHFGLVGPLFFATGGAGSVAAILDMAGAMLAAGEAERMLVGQVGAGEALYLLLEGEQGGRPLCPLDQARAVVASGRDVAAMAHEFSLLKGTKGAT